MYTMYVCVCRLSMLELMGSRNPSKVQLLSGSKVVQIQTQTPEQPSLALAADGADAATSPGLKRPHKKQYTFKGGCNALAVQLFAIEDKFETRYVIARPRSLR